MEIMKFDAGAAHRNRSISRIGVTFINVAFTLGIIALILMFASFFAPLISFIVYIFMFILIVCTLFLILLNGNAFDGMLSLVDQLMAAAVTIGIVSIVLYVISAVFMVLGWVFIGKDKQWPLAIKARGRINFLIGLGITFLIVGGIALAAGGLGGGA